MKNALPLIAFAAFPVCAHAQEPLARLDLSYTAEVIGAVDGGLINRGYLLDNLSIEAAVSLERLVGWRGARLGFHLLNNSGGEPNAGVGTLEGVSNIEVARQRGKVFEAWLEQDLPRGAGSLAVGFLDLNREFYATDASGLFLSPPFGIGSEIAATGLNGPSIFPSTAFGARWRIDGDDAWYGQIATMDAKAGVLGDPDEVSIDFSEGALVVAEAGLVFEGKAALGLWTYTEDQEDVRLTGPDGEPAPAEAQGAYLLLEQPIGDDWDMFARVGVSDGDTTDFSGGGQIGVVGTGLAPFRPKAMVGLGARYAAISEKARANARDAGEELARSEWGIELTYADQVTSWLTLQPNAQVVFNPGGSPTRDPALVLGLRASFAWAAERS